MSDEIIKDYKVEPELMAPPPRRLFLPLGTRVLFASAVLLIILFFYGGCLLLFNSAQLVYVAVTGKTAVAHIIRIDSVPSGDLKQSVVETGIAYQFDSPFPNNRPPQVQYSKINLGEVPYDIQDYLHRRRKGAFDIPDYHIGDPLLFRYTKWHGRTILHPWNRPPYAKIAAMSAMGMAVITVGFVIMRRLLHWRKGGLRLMRHGVATPGTILHKRSDTSEVPRYYVLYGFELTESGGTRQREERCTIDQWKKFDVGQTVTVLYDPADTSVAGLYPLL
jgi:hypothetical protein